MKISVVNGAPATIDAGDMSDEQLFAALPKYIPLTNTKELGPVSRDALILFVLARQEGQARDPRQGQRASYKELALRFGCMARIKEEYPTATGDIYIIADGMAIASFGGERYDPFLC